MNKINDDTKQLIESVRANDLILFKKLFKLQHVNPALNDNIAIILAVQNQNYEMVKLLLSDNRVSPSVNYNMPIEICTNNGNSKIFNLLISDRRVYYHLDCNAFSIACKNGYEEFVLKMIGNNLLNKAKDNNKAIKEAFKAKHFNIVFLLIKNENVKSQLQKNDVDLYNEISLIKNISSF
jgi:hypothetical protein